MRIIAGKYRGTKLTDVGAGDEEAHLRPTSDRVRENLFNVLDGGRYGNALQGARVLDLFAGTGALGLEALSRGAQRVCFVENGRAAGKLLMKNIARLSAAEMVTHLRKDATTLPPNPYAPFDLVFLDPPYGKAMGQAALTSARAGGWLAEGVLIIWEEAEPMTPPEGFTLSEHRRYGGTQVTFLTL